MNVQNPNPSSPSTANRKPWPRSFDAARARAVSHLGLRRWAVDGSGRWPAAVPATTGAAAAIASGIQHVHQRASGVVTGEPQENLLQTRKPRLGVRAKLLHR